MPRHQQAIPKPGNSGQESQKLPMVWSRKMRESTSDIGDWGPDTGGCRDGVGISSNTDKMAGRGTSCVPELKYEQTN